MIALIRQLFRRTPPGVRTVIEILDQNPEIRCPWCGGVEIHETHCELMS